MSEQNGLPPGWAWTTLGDVCSKPQYGWTTKANNETGSVRLLRTTDISKGSVAWDTVPYCTEVPEALEAYLLCAGDLVISRAGSVGLSYLVNHVPEPTVFASYLIRFRAGDGVEPQYLAYYLQTPTYWNAVYEQSAGIALANINARKLEAMSVPLAPLAEQHRIVAAIEQQFTRLDAGVAALRRVRAALKRYRAAVLKAAVEGRLTEAWRAAHPDAEPAAALLARILAERRARWEADLRARGKDPAKVRYAEPAVPDTASPPALPEGWCWATLGALTQRIGDVDHKMPKPVSLGVPYISTKDFTGENGIDFDGAKRISREDFIALGRKIRPEVGDLLLSRYGTVGEVRLVQADIEFEASYSVAIIKTMPMPSIHGYLALALKSDATQAQIKRDIRASAQPDLGLEYIRELAIPLPPVAEQVEIVAEVERRLSVVSELEAAIEANLTRAERLRQSILERAFSGRLVPQDPRDEPASALLERIRRDREQVANRPAWHNAHNDGYRRGVGGTQGDRVPATRQAGLWGSGDAYQE